MNDTPQTPAAETARDRWGKPVNPEVWWGQNLGRWGVDTPAEPQQPDREGMTQ